MPDWLDQAVFYEIYPQSFCDSNGDGIGDLPGIVEKLDYLKDLGVNALWINPCFDSPFKDAGYDVRDYRKIAPRYGTNQDMARLFQQAHSRGIRVLRQDEWEMLVSFIISQRKSIPAIRRAVELLSERFGERLGSDSEGPVYAFPTAEALCCAGEQALQECGLGYRTRYVLHAAQQAAEGTLDLKKLASLPDEALFARLMELDGVGKKVANCVCLFGYGRVGRVPVDVWIERLIRDEFAGQDPFPQFGLEAGIVQQYLFFYKRSVG